MSGARVALELPDGQLVTDPEWRCEADVLRSAHGIVGRDRMPGRLVRLEPDDN